jgi:hypothetical protein
MVFMKEPLAYDFVKTSFFLRIFVWKKLGNQPLEKLNKLGCCWDNIKMDLEEIGCGTLNLTVLTQDRANWWGFVLLVLNV